MPGQKEQKPYTKREREGNGPGGKLEAVITIGSFEMTYELVPTCTHIVKNDKKFYTFNFKNFTNNTSFKCIIINKPLKAQGFREKWDKLIVMRLHTKFSR